MFHSLFRSLYQRWQIHSLSKKLLVPSVGLMLLALLGSSLAFVEGTALTRNRLLEQQTATEAERVIKILTRRVDDVANAASLLANDPAVVDAVREESLSTLNSRAVVVRDRFGLALIQVFDRHGQPRTNLMTSSLYRESSMLAMVESGSPVVRVVNDHLLLLGRAPMPNDAGTVVVGLDLEAEMRRILTKYRLPVELGLSVRGVDVGTRRDLPFDAAKGWVDNLYNQRMTVSLGATSADLLLVRSTTDITRITRTGLFVMVGSLIFTTLLLSSLNVMIIRCIARPIHQLSAAAEAVAGGDLNQEVTLARSPFSIGSHDEIGWLAEAFNDMVADLRGLYGNLEAKVETRTQELATTARLAGAVSSSLELDSVLKKSARIIQDRLDVYHVGIFLVEQGSDVAILRGIASESEQSLKPKEFQIPLGSHSPVGIAAATGHINTIQNVRIEPVHLKPPLLMETCSATAVPLTVGETVIGVLDIQSRECDTFGPATVRLLATLADQIATGVHNARLYEQQRRTAEHLAEVDRLKTQFLAVMSHELRTPLNTIIGFSKVLLNGLDGPLTEKQEQDLTFIHKSGQHLLSLIRDILDVSQINAGKIELDIKQVDLEEVIDNALDAIPPLIEDKPVALCKDIEPGLPVIRADKRRVRQIMLNLLSNAAKFTESGQIAVHARLIEALNAEGERMEPFVEVSVIDTGVGIPEDKLVQVFEEFTQVDSSSTRRFEGTGLGLPITKKLVELHKGRIWVESEPGQGSVFTFTLPVNQPEVCDFEGDFSTEEFKLEMKQEVEYEMAT